MMTYIAAGAGVYLLLSGLLCYRLLRSLDHPVLDSLDVDEA